MKHETYELLTDLIEDLEWDLPRLRKELPAVIQTEEHQKLVATYDAMVGLKLVLERLT